MALFKILSGPEKKNAAGTSVMLTPGKDNSPAFHEGWAYVTHDGNLYVDLIKDKINTRVKIASKTDFAIKAEQDSAGLNIRDNYITSVTSTDHATAPFLSTFSGSGSKLADIPYPIASETLAGLVTTADQSFKGAKTFKNLFVINDSSNSSHDALVYLQNKSSQDWALVIEKGNFDYGIQIKSSGANALVVANGGGTKLTGLLNVTKDVTLDSNLEVANTISVNKGAATINASGYVEGTWLKTNSTTRLSDANQKRFAVLDNYGWIYYRDPVDIAGDIDAVRRGGDSMYGDLQMTEEKHILFNIPRKKTGGGGWAYVPISTTGTDGKKFFQIGVFGNANTFNYAYFTSTGSYDSTNHLRMYADGGITTPKMSVGQATQNSSYTLYVKGTANITSHLSTSGNLSVAGDGSVVGALTVNGATEITNTLKVTQNTELLKDLSVGGATDLKGNVTIGTAATNTLIVNSATSLKSTLNVTDKATFENQLVSKVQGGTSPFIVASNTLVTNLNADLIDGRHVKDELFGGSLTSSRDIVPTQYAIWESFQGMLQSLQGLIYRRVLSPVNEKITAPTSIYSGDVYVFGGEGTFSGTDTYVEPGDMAIVYKDGSTLKWNVVQMNIDGAVRIQGGGAINTAHVTNQAIARFDGTTGRVIQNSGVLIDNDGNITILTDNKQNIGASTKRWKEIYAVNFRGLADQATSDEGGQDIRGTYIADIILVNSASQPYYNLINGNGITLRPTNLPVATTTNAGVLTADRTNTQTITGNKVIDSQGSLTIKKASGFIYEGIEADNSAKARPVWYAHADRNGTPCYNTNFTFNPASSAAWTDYDSGTTATAHGLLKVARLDGLARKALQDDQGLTIKKTYLKALVLQNHATQPYYQYTYGDGTTSGTLNLPVASTSNAGVITNAAQTLAGNKIFTQGIKIRGTAASQPLVVRGIVGSNGTNDTVAELYLQYGADKAIMLGNTGAYNISADGSKYSGRAANADLADKATNDASGNAITSYIRGLTLDSNTSRIFTITYGSGTTAQLKPLFAASSSHGGAATSAEKWSTARKITLAGDATGSVSLDGTADQTLTVKLVATSTAFNNKYLRKDADDTTGYKLTITNSTSPTSSTGAAAFKVTGGATFGGNVYTGKLYNAVWNDYAEFREAETRKPGRVIIEHKSGEMKVSTKRLQPGGLIISDTFGHAMGQTKKCRTPVAVAGRVLAYPYEDRNSYPLGAAVCTGPGGTVSLMTRAEIREYPERIIGTVSEIPEYETWGQDNIKVNGRIWIKVK